MSIIIIAIGTEKFNTKCGTEKELDMVGIFSGSKVKHARYLSKNRKYCRFRYHPKTSDLTDWNWL